MSPPTLSGIDEEPTTTHDQDNSSSSSINTDSSSNPPATNSAHDANIATLLERLASTEARFLRERASNEALRGALNTLQRRAAGSAGARDKGNGGPTAKIPQDSSNSAAAAVVDAESSERLRGDSRAGAGSRGRGESEGGRREERPPWKNILYKRQPYPDNYVPQSFLEKLVTNGESNLQNGSRDPNYSRDI